MTVVMEASTELLDSSNRTDDDVQKCGTKLFQFL